MRALQIGREEAFLNGFEAWKSGCKWEKDGLLRTRTLIIHSQTHKATTPRHDPWESAHSNLAPRNDHERGGAGRPPEDQRFHFLPVLVDHEDMIHVSKDLTVKTLQTTVLPHQLAEGLQSSLSVAADSSSTPITLLPILLSWRAASPTSQARKAE